MRGIVIGIGALAMLAGFGWVLTWMTAQAVKGSDGEEITLVIVAGILGVIGVAIMVLAAAIL